MRTVSINGKPIKSNVQRCMVTLNLFARLLYFAFPRSPARPPLSQPSFPFRSVPSLASLPRSLALHFPPPWNKRRKNNSHPTTLPLSVPLPSSLYSRMTKFQRGGRPAGQAGCIRRKKEGRTKNPILHYLRFPSPRGGREGRREGASERTSQRELHAR